MSLHYSTCIRLLKGGPIDLAVGGFSMVLSFGFHVAGCIVMTDKNVNRVFNVQPVAFLVAQSFSVTAVWRDRYMRQSHMLHIDKPTLLYSGQSISFFVIALGFVVFNLAALAKWPGFYAASSGWVIVSALSLSKILRDRNYADIFGRVSAEDQVECMPKISMLCKGSVEYQIFVWLSSLFGVLLLLGIVWTYDDQTLEVKSKGFISVCALWCEGSSFHLAKLCRDHSDPVKSKELRDQIPYQLLVVASCVVSHIVMILIISFHSLEDWQRFNLFVGWGFALTTMFILARHIRDRLDLTTYLKTPEAASPHPDGAHSMPPMHSHGSFQSHGSYGPAQAQHMYHPDSLRGNQPMTHVSPMPVGAPHAASHAYAQQMHQNAPDHRGMANQNGYQNGNAHSGGGYRHEPHHEYHSNQIAPRAQERHLYEYGEGQEHYS